MEYAMELNNITQIFSGKCVLNHINLNARKGEVLGLLGPSGAGKTTLIKIITGQLKQTSGTAHLFGKNITPDCRKIGIMMDDFGLYDRLSVYANMKFYAEIYHVSKERIIPVLQKAGLFDAKNTSVSKLSKGMRNRLSFARAVLKDVDILFLDEPTSGLDPATTKDIHKMLWEEKEKNTLKVLMMSNVKPAEYLLGVGGYIWFICMIGSAVFCLEGKYMKKEAILFMGIMAIGIFVSLLIGAAIGTLSSNQMMATSITVPIMMIFSFLPMLSMFNEKIETIAKFIYSQQISILISQIKNWEPDIASILVIISNIVIAALLFAFSYRKCGLA